MASIPDSFLVHWVVLEALEAHGTYGEVYASPTEHRAFITSKSRLVGTGDEQLVSEGSVVMAKGVRVPDGSRIYLRQRLADTLASPRDVVAVSYADDGNMGAWEHTRVDIT